MTQGQNGEHAFDGTSHGTGQPVPAPLAARSAKRSILEHQMNIYVGNLASTTTEEELRERASQFGEVASVNIITDRGTGQSRGFGFLDMPNEDEARATIAGLNGTDLGGSALTVNEARPRPERRSGSSD